MNILFCGQYRGGYDGWSCASRDYVSALLLTGHNISLKPIYMASGNGPELPSEFIAAENNKLDKIDVIIQHVLPDILEWHEGYNIALVHTETNNLYNSIWINKLNLMDEVWVGSTDEAKSLMNSGVKCKISVVPVPVNTKLLETHKNGPKLDLFKNKFIFYFIGENTDRKNIMAFVKAFHREFGPEEEVGIIIKTNSDEIKNQINEWKTTSRTRGDYIPELLISGFLPEEELYKIHRTGDCFVLTSRGEAQCRPMMDAIYFGNHVICTNGISAASLFDGILKINSIEIPVDTKHPPLPHIYTGQETWKEIDILQLQEEMRGIFDDREFISAKTTPHISTYSIESIEEIMKCLLSEI